MSEETELRDRIARVVEERNAFYGGNSGHAAPRTIAQAIIDEFGLAVEVGACSNHQRVVGTWEKQ